MRNRSAIWAFRCFFFCVVYMVIGVVWLLIDYIEFGKSQPSISDTLFGLLLADLICWRLEPCLVRWWRK